MKINLNFQINDRNQQYQNKIYKNQNINRIFTDKKNFISNIYINQIVLEQFLLKIFILLI